MKSLKTTDPKVFELVQLEEKRQREVLEMIPSENYTSKARITTARSCKESVGEKPRHCRTHS